MRLSYFDTDSDYSENWTLTLYKGNSLKVAYTDTELPNCYIGRIYVRNNDGNVAELTATPNEYTCLERSWGNYYLWYHYYNGATNYTKEVTFTATEDVNITNISTTNLTYTGDL